MECVKKTAGLGMNVGKTKILKVCKGEVVIKIQGCKIKNVEVEYLGSIFS